MNENIKKLYQIAKKRNRKIIGLMSGTSMDGLDIALCDISGSGGKTKVKLEKFMTISYEEAVKDKIRAVFAKRNIDFQHLCVLNAWLGVFHGKMVLEALATWKIEPEMVDLVASHGQTVFHAPKTQHKLADYDNATLQIGDGDHLAVTTNIITLSDFRQKHVAKGGEGAPLAVYGDYFIFSKKSENRIMLNMGGIANFTYLPADLDASAVFTTDTGPGNTLLDAFIRRFYPHLDYDKDAQMAKQGICDQALLAALKKDDFFDKPFPKTTGPEVFNPEYVENALKKIGKNAISPNDLLATLTHFSADTIADAIKKVLKKGEKYVVYTSGGGMHNPLLMQLIQQQLAGLRFRKTDEIAIAGDAKEAVLFAILANECLAGGKTYFGDRQGVPSTTMGKVSFPS